MKTRNTTATLNGSIQQWKLKLVKVGNSILKKYSKQQHPECNNIGIHLAVFSEPYLGLILDGKKTIESRFSLNKTGPFFKVCSGDLVFIKRNGGPICGYFIVGKTKFISDPSEKEFSELKRNYATEICASADMNFWEDRKDARYISLLKVAQVKPLPPLPISKKDRMAWVVIQYSNKLDVHS